jgi:dTDP-4-dehydrorhamnose reductase
MRLLVTGMHGTVAPRLAEHATAAGHEVLAWDRDAVPPDDPDACWAFLHSVRPDAIAHLAFGAESWAGLLAAASRERSLPFLYTSTAMVFAQRPDGPYRPEQPPTADTEYGQYKARCEQAVQAANPDAMVARLAYQVDLPPASGGRREGAGGNHLLAHCEAAHASGEPIRASTRWIPALAFLDDTAAALLGLLTEPRPGIHHLDGNATSTWDHHRVVEALARQLDRPWRIEPTEDPVHDQRLLASDLIAPIDARLS